MKSESLRKRVSRGSRAILADVARVRRWLARRYLTLAGHHCSSTRDNPDLTRSARSTPCECPSVIERQNVHLREMHAAVGYYEFSTPHFAELVQYEQFVT